MLQCGMSLRVNELSRSGKETMVIRFDHKGLRQLQNCAVSKHFEFGELAGAPQTFNCMLGPFQTKQLAYNETDFTLTQFEEVRSVRPYYMWRHWEVSSVSCK